MFDDIFDAVTGVITRSCLFPSISFQGGLIKLTSLTVVAEDEEAGSREVRVELDQDDVGGGVDRLQSRVPAKLADLRGRLVRAVPGRRQRQYN